MVARRYSPKAPGDTPQTPVICIPGLTRNAADFSELAPRIAATGRETVVLSLRGRGPSDYDPAYTNYRPTVYAEDVLHALDQLGWPKAICVGTSLGGIITMLIAENQTDRIAGTVINDIGPDIAPEGLAHIAQYTANASEPHESLDAAARATQSVHGGAFPDANFEDWLRWAERTFRQIENGKWCLDYDPNIVRAFSEIGPAPDLWPGWRALSKTPTLLVHGLLSNLLSIEIVESMRAARPDFDYVQAPRIGHAPFMTEDSVWPSIAAFLEKIE